MGGPTLIAALSSAQPPTVQRRQMTHESSPKPRGLVASLMMSLSDLRSYSQGYRCPSGPISNRDTESVACRCGKDGPFLLPRGRVYPGCPRLPTWGHTWFLALTALPAAVLRRSRAGIPGASLGDPNHSQGGRRFLPWGTPAEARPTAGRGQICGSACEEVLRLSCSCRALLSPSGVLSFR